MNYQQQPQQHYAQAGYQQNYAQPQYQPPMQQQGLLPNPGVTGNGMPPPPQPWPQQQQMRPPQQVAPPGAQYPPPQYYPPQPAPQGYPPQTYYYPPPPPLEPKPDPIPPLGQVVTEQQIMQCLCQTRGLSIREAPLIMSFGIRIGQLSPLADGKYYINVQSFREEMEKWHAGGGGGKGKEYPYGPGGGPGGWQ
ncbi:hypothetical protein IFR04_016312 [Cadophora malorum]|uniref:Uncharacterized protein n=1 Tax=Cadophora malorum TaxID=108018 RepID=A0A8H7T027_9HELO|nr:hypothetical protein IFR04_016312 [Cadophora malorum]